MKGCATDLCIQILLHGEDPSTHYLLVPGLLYQSYTLLYQLTWFPSVQSTTSMCQATDDAAGQGGDFLQGWTRAIWEILLETWGHSSQTSLPGCWEAVLCQCLLCCAR